MSFPNPSFRNDQLVQLIGTISVVQPLGIDVVSNHYVQRIILDNTIAVNNVMNLPSRLLIVIQLIRDTDPIPFRVNDPITVKGFYKQQPPESLSYIYNTHSPSGFIRYNGKIYR